jgi:trans-AT polyketide synthase, acyltransferase and oxidoreductase domains
MNFEHHASAALAPDFAAHAANYADLPRIAFAAADISTFVARVRESVQVVRRLADGAIGVTAAATAADLRGEFELMATLPPLYPEWLGDRSFCEVHGVRFPYVAGEMANGIATVRMVVAMAEAEMLGFFGAAGLSYERVERAVDELISTLGELPWGINLIHSPSESALEDRVADLLIRRQVKRISASAFMALTPAVVRCSAAGLRRDAQGNVVRVHQLFAKVSRAEVARHFLLPAPLAMLQQLQAQGLLTADEVAIAQTVPVAEDITVEADSGGHTDNQSLVALFPTIMQLRDKLSAQYKYARPIRIGAAGGLGSPSGVAAAFGMGAAYVVTGSVNQSAIEAGLCDAGKAMLAKADVADVIMAPAADMFELGVQVQVLRRGTMFGVRAAKLYEIYREYASTDAIPEDIRLKLERDLFRAPLTQIWDETYAFWQKRDHDEAERGAKDPKHRMALVFRWYLGKASRWAIEGDPARTADYQIWSGPAMGSFNQWTAGSFLAEPAARTVVQIALNLLEGAAVVTRAGQLRTYGAPVCSSSFQFAPRPLA